MNRTRPIFALAIILLCAGCDGGTTIEGTIRDPNGKPISGVAFSLALDSSEQLRLWRTEADGRYLLSRTHAPFKGVPLHLRFEKEGYETSEFTLYSDGQSRRRVDVTLRPLGGIKAKSP